MPHIKIGGKCEVWKEDESRCKWEKKVVFGRKWEREEWKGENYRRIKERSERLVRRENNVQESWKEYFEDLYNMGIEK